MKYVLVTTPNCSRCAAAKERLTQARLSGFITEGNFNDYQRYVLKTPYRSAPVFLAIDDKNECVEFAAVDTDEIIDYMAPLRNLTRRFTPQDVEDARRIIAQAEDERHGQE